MTKRRNSSQFAYSESPDQQCYDSMAHLASKIYRQVSKKRRQLGLPESSNSTTSNNGLTKLYLTEVLQEVTSHDFVVGDALLQKLQQEHPMLSHSSTFLEFRSVIQPQVKELRERKQEMKWPLMESFPSPTVDIIPEDFSDPSVLCPKWKDDNFYGPLPSFIDLLCIQHFRPICRLIESIFPENLEPFCRLIAESDGRLFTMTREKNEEARNLIHFSSTSGVSFSERIQEIIEEEGEDHDEDSSEDSEDPLLAVNAALPKVLDELEATPNNPASSLDNSKKASQNKTKTHKFPVLTGKRQQKRNIKALEEMLSKFNKQKWSHDIFNLHELGEDKFHARFDYFHLATNAKKKESDPGGQVHIFPISVLRSYLTRDEYTEFLLAVAKEGPVTLSEKSFKRLEVLVKRAMDRSPNSDNLACFRVGKKKALRRASSHPPQCEACGKRKKAMKRCSSCHQAFYCDRECQVKGWPEHRMICTKRKEKSKENAV